MKIILIGGTKFIGYHLLKELSGHQHEILIFNRGISTPLGTIPSNVKQIKGDHKDLLTFKQTFSKFEPDVVIDMVCFSQQDAQVLVNTFSSFTKRIIAISSADVYQSYEILWDISRNDYLQGRMTENSVLRQTLFPCRHLASGVNDWLYHYDKMLVEKTLQTSSCPTTILRLPAVYGPGDISRLDTYLKPMLQGKREISIDADMANWRMSRVYVKDVATAIRLCIEDKSLKSRIFNVSENSDYSELEWAKKIASLVGWDGKFKLLPKDQLPESPKYYLNWKQDFVIDSALIKKELSFRESTFLDDCIIETIEYIKPLISNYQQKLVKDPNEDENLLECTPLIEDFKVRLYGMNELIIMLKEVGFKNVKVMKAFDKEGIPNDNDEVILFECRK